jgi:ligand-binding sensor domain-containing protein/signal transduction histidine kinase
LRSSNIFHDARISPWLRLSCVAIASCILCSAAHAIDGGPTTRYLRQRYGPEQGLSGGTVSAIAQTPDGYLWIGTDKELVRFDGQTFRSTPTDPSVGSIDHVLSLTVDGQGVLWIRMQDGKICRYEKGHFEPGPVSLETDSGITAMSSATDGGILLATLNHGVVVSSGNSMERLATPTQPLFISIAQTKDRQIWFGSRGEGLFFLHGKDALALDKVLPDKKVNCLLPAADGQLWIGTDNGLALWTGKEMSVKPMPVPLAHAQILSMLQDRQGNLWIGTAHGLVRYNSAIASVLPHGEHKSDDAINTLYEDREGNIWFGCSHWIERVRESPFATFSSSDGLPGDSYGPIATDISGRTWIAPLRGGLYWLRDRKLNRVTSANLDSDIVYSIGTSNDGDIWLGRQRGGLTHLHIDKATTDAKTYKRADGLAQDSIYAVRPARDGSVWAATLTAGVSRFNDGKFKNYTTADGLSSNSVSAIEEGADGTMWFATSRGVSSFSASGWRSYSIGEGLPASNVTSLFQDSRGVLWIGTARGLAYFKAGHLHSASQEPDSLQESILGIAEDKAGFLWIATANHFLRAKRDDLLRDTISPEEINDFGLTDGLLGNGGMRRERSVTTDARGHIWVSMNKGLSEINPELLNLSSAAAIVHVDNLWVDGSPIDQAAGRHLSPGNHRVVFNYTGLNFSAPQRVRYKYRLDGFDHGWSEPLDNRQATYTNLAPGDYRFRVVASNSEGQWNGPEGILPISVEPLFWQTERFRFLCALVLVLLAFTFYRIRMRQVMKQASLRFEERLAERTRIAQELHDTLLQGLFNASLRLQTATDQVPAQSPAKAPLDSVLRLMDQVMEEGRNAVRGLRAASTSVLPLEQAFATMLEAMVDVRQVNRNIVIKGVTRPLHSEIYEEICRIGRESILNIFQHAQADTIRISIQYSARELQLKFCDNGRGMDAQILSSGRDGHWGIAGMRERAAKIGGKLQISSRATEGTEVELTIPGHIAYNEPSVQQLWHRFRRRFYPKSNS